jgi:hypothetical protein
MSLLSKNRNKLSLKQKRQRKRKRRKVKIQSCRIGLLLLLPHFQMYLQFSAIINRYLDLEELLNTIIKCRYSHQDFRIQHFSQAPCPQQLIKINFSQLYLFIKIFQLDRILLLQYQLPHKLRHLFAQLTY